jgi:hypothetical protein
MSQPIRAETKPRARQHAAQPIPELAVVDIVRVQNGRRELAVGVVLAVDSDDDSYTVELVKTRGGTELISASAGELRVRHVL